MALHDLSAEEMLAGFKSRALSPFDVTQAILDRIAQWEPHLHATYALNGEQALAQAHASEARWRTGATLGPLDGVPVMIKENIATRGNATPLGTAATELRPSPVDAPPAQRLRESGAVILGKTTMPDYGMLSSGLSSFHELTRNPWNLAANPGGSSAGSGAGVAAGYGPLHLGTDIGGSVRLPAGWCGIFALKPSNGRIPIDPPYIGRVAGPMTRHVRDAALAMQVLSQPDARDHMSLPHQAIDWLALESEVKGLRIGLLRDVGCGLKAEPQVLQAVEQAARLLQDAGAHVELMPPFLTPTMLNGLDDFWRARAWADLAALPEERRKKALPFIVDWARAAQRYDGQRVFKGFGQIMAMRLAATEACAPYDFILSPTAPLPAFAAELPCPTNDPSRPFEHIAFTVAFNMSEQPAASINCGYTDDGRPIGLQIVGQRFDDLGVLRLAYQFEQLRPAQRPWPEPPAV